MDNDNAFGDGSSHEGSQGLAPVYWMHIPKAGISLLNTLILNKEVCPFWAEFADELNVTGLLSPDGTFGEEAEVRQIMMNHPTHFLKACPNGFAYTKEALGPRTIGQHLPIDDIWENLKDVPAHPVVMIRQPEQRLLSDYYYMAGADLNLTQQIKLSEGCQVRYFTRGFRDFCDDSVPLTCKEHCLVQMAPVTDKEVMLAKSRLRDFAFVGITDQWDLSMCLWNAMLNQTCSSSQFTNLHKTKAKTSSSYDTSVLNGFVDAYDGAFYAEAVRIFKNNLIRYNVSEDVCKHACKAR